MASTLRQLELPPRALVKAVVQASTLRQLQLLPKALVEAVVQANILRQLELLPRAIVKAVVQASTLRQLELHFVKAVVQAGTQIAPDRLRVMHVVTERIKTKPVSLLALSAKEADTRVR